MALEQVLSGPGVEFSFNYNANNRRIASIDYVVSAGKVVNAKLWSNGNLVYNQDLTGTGSINVPGQHQMVDDPVLGLVPPDGIWYQITQVGD